MTKLLTRSLAVILALLAVGTVWAFKPGPDTIRECPGCKAQVREQTTLSGNTFRAQYWTDGKREAPMLPDFPWLVKCPKCGKRKVEQVYGEVLVKTSKKS